MSPERVGVVGGGLMGSGIAEVFARSGAQVVIHEIDAGAAEGAQARVESSLAKAVERGKLEVSLRDQALANIRVSTDLTDQADRQLVIEAATEDEALKKQLFSDLDAIVTDPNAILASNTSSIPITRLASVTSRPDHVVGLHFFNPVPVMTLVELVTTVMTAPEVSARARAYAESAGKTVIEAG
ncbi:MAG TPA: 3-hydroxyacyl-CoA dehydrogenase NAD-binding domain-containing protein, partial [Acidimicrobiia bacterium]